MRLHKIELCNFRVFFGIHTLEFACEEGRAVTLFHGENGAGKTNLLNAIHWCITGEFTPRFQDTGLLINKSAAQLGERETYVELSFSDAGLHYRARRSSKDSMSELKLFLIRHGSSTPVNNPEYVLHKIIPKGLVSWFFFDAEAIGSLELSGSEQFKRDLRSTLGFQLVDRLISDLEACRNKRQRDLSSQTNDGELKVVQEKIDDIGRVLPGQVEERDKLDAQIKSTRDILNQVQGHLAALPKAAKAQERRQAAENRIKTLVAEKRVVEAKIAATVGAAAPTVLIRELALGFEGTLQTQEVQARAPSSYNDQLVNQIIESQQCLCGRAVLPDSHEADCIKGLLKVATTGVVNQRIRELQYLLRSIEETAHSYPARVAEARERQDAIDRQIADYEEELRQIAVELAAVDEAEIHKLERERGVLLEHLIALNTQKGRYEQRIGEMEANSKNLQLRYERASSKLNVGKKLKKELDKISRLLEFIRTSLKAQELRALRILSAELNAILGKYLTKHYQARINPSTYAVQLLDEQGRTVGHSTGEGQILKFAFISTVIALAARKTQEKIEWMAEPTVAPLVLDAPFSALDPEYQGAVARSLATQTTQLVLMISSAGWGEKVSNALEPFVGKRYLVLSKSAGEQGEKPLKTMIIGQKIYALNEYGAARDESEFVEVK